MAARLGGDPLGTAERVSEKKKKKRGLRGLVLVGLGRGVSRAWLVTLVAAKERVRAGREAVAQVVVRLIDG